jgi:hypothetical protein
MSNTGKFELVMDMRNSWKISQRFLLAFHFLSLGDFGIIPRLCKTVYYYSQGCFTL